MAAGLIRTLLFILLLASPLQGQSVRIATFHTGLSRDGPGLLLRDIVRAQDAQIDAVINVINMVRPDVILLLDFDYDAQNQALKAFRNAIVQARGPEYTYVFSRMPNSGLATGLDMDNDGRLNQPRDAQGYGHYTGQGGMAVLSRLPIEASNAIDFSTFLWRDLPNAMLPLQDGAPFLSPKAAEVQRLSSVAHWQVPIQLPGGARLDLLAFHATTPVFDGPEDRNGRRNHDEILFWPLLLEGALPFTPPRPPFVILGDANLDPDAGDGLRSAIAALLAHRSLQDPKPVSEGAAALGDATDTVDWAEPTPGNLRVDYVLPSSDLDVVDQGVFWPMPGQKGAEAAAVASRHRLVWVDIAIPQSGD